MLCSFALVCGVFATCLRWKTLNTAKSAQLPPATPQPEALNDLSSPSQPSLPSTSPLVAASLPKPTSYARDLVKALSRLDRSRIALTAEEAQQWKRTLDELIAQGPDGAAAIAEFLQSNTDVMFGRAGRELLGFDSAREAFFDVLVRIGGPEAVSAMLQALQNSADPREIALLAQNLDKLAPGMHRHDALNAAREVLAMAKSGKLPNADVAPVFEVLQNYGGSDVVTDLEQAARQWEYYSAVALTHLPEGAGIPSLIQMVQENRPAATTALQSLAQLSGDHGQAQAALLAQAQANAIPPYTWPFLVTALAGNEYHFQNSGFFSDRAHPGNVSTAHISSGNQTFYNAFNPGSLTQEQINSRIAFIDQLRAVTSQPAALQALQQAADLLVKRLPNTAAASR